MNFEIPTDLIHAQGSICNDLTGVSRDATELDLSGKARGLTQLASFHRLRRMWISGVNRQTADLIGVLPNLKSLVIFGLRTDSMHFLSDLKKLDSLAICQSPKLRSLVGIEALGQLRSLILFDCAAVDSLDPVRHLHQLRTLSVEGTLRRPVRVPTLAPLAGLDKLRNLRLAAIRVEDQSLQPVYKLRLRTVTIARTFPESEFEALRTEAPNLWRRIFDDDSSRS